MTKSRFDDLDPQTRVRVTAIPGGFRVNLPGVQIEESRTAKQLLWMAGAFLDAALETMRLREQALPMTATEVRVRQATQGLVLKQDQDG